MTVTAVRWLAAWRRKRLWCFRIFSTLLVLWLALALSGILLDGRAWTSSDTIINGKRLPQRHITGSDMARLAMGNSEVRYPAGAEKLATEALAILVAEETIIAESLGLNLRPFGIVLHGPMVAGHEYSPIVSCPQDRTVFAVAILSKAPGQPLTLDSSEIYHTMTHERSEEMLTDAIGANSLYIANPHTRWIGDGMAEFVADKACRALSPTTRIAHLRNRREALDDLPIGDFNLLIWRSPTRSLLPFMSVTDGDWAKKELEKLGAMAKLYSDTPVGYSVALAFWLDFANRHGEPTLKKALTQLAAQTDLRNQPICERLGMLTGEDVFTQCQSFSIQKAKDILDQAIADAEKDAASKKH